MTKKRNVHPLPSAARLSVVMPVYNAEKWMKPTLMKLADSLKNSAWKSIEIIIVDDGSTDKTFEAIKSIDIGVKIKVISQKNSGRFLARKRGLENSIGYYIFFIDSRVFAKKDSFTYLVNQMKKLPEAVIWNGHVEVDRKGNLFARFWHVITFIAWRKYMSHPRLLHYGIKDFDYYPKGTTCFFAPRNLLLKAYNQFNTSYSDLRNVNDDSALIRYMAKDNDIYISPGFAFTYHSRSTLKTFIKHTLHRGVVFIDGYMHLGTRYFMPLILYFLFLPIILITLVLFPQIILAIPLLLTLLLLFILILRVDWLDAVAFIILLPVFMFFYSIGLFKGVLLKLHIL